MAPALPLAVVANVISFVNDMTLSDATRRGDLELVKLLVAVDKSKCTAQHMDTAATYGHLEIVKFLHRASPSGCTAAAMDGAIHYGQLEVVRFLHFNRTEGCTAAARCLLGAQLSGGPAMARFFIQHLPMKMCNCILRHAVAWDDLELVADILHMRPSAEAAKAKEDAINYSRDSSRTISILKLLYEKGEDKTPSRALVHAARRRNSDAIKYLLDQGEGFVREAVGEAVRWDGGEIVQLFLNDARVQLNHTEVTSLVDLAASARFSVESRPAVVEVLRERYPDAVCSPRTFVRAAKQGHLAVVKALYSAVRMETYSEALVKAALYHKHDVVGFLASVCDDAQLQDGGATALFNGNLRIAKYLVSFWRERNGAKSDISDNATDCSPEMLEILDRVYRNGATEDSVNVFVQAAYSGDLGVVAYLSERNIGNLHDAIMEAIRRGHLTIVRYLIECTRVTATRTIAKRKWMPRAACFGHLDVLIYLDENVPGAMCPSIAMDHAAARGYLDVVRFLHTHRTEGCTTHAMDGAAYGNHFEIVRFLHENRTEGCSPRAFEKSAKRGLTEMVKLLLEIVPTKCNVDKGILLARRNGFEETVAALEAFKAKIC